MTRTSAAASKPSLAAIQVSPLLVVLKTPASVAANSVEGFAGSMASAKTFPVGRPQFADAQVAPPSGLLRTPERDVAANTVEGAIGSVTSMTTSVPSGPIAVQRFTPASAAVSRTAIARHTAAAATR